MEKKEDVIYQQYLVGLDDTLSKKMVQFTKEHDIKLTALIRRCLRQFFKDEELKEQTKSGKKNDKK